MSLQAGDSFFAPWPDPKRNWHLYFVISDPALNRERVLVVPIMTWTSYSESVCLVENGDHPFVRHTSFISYFNARVVTADVLEQKILTQEFRTHARASTALLERKQPLSVAKPMYMFLPYLYILEEQKLVEPGLNREIPMKRRLLGLFFILLAHCGSSLVLADGDDEKNPVNHSVHGDAFPTKVRARAHT